MKNKIDTKPIRQGGQVYIIAGKDEFLVKNECERLLDENQAGAKNDRPLAS